MSLDHSLIPADIYRKRRQAAIDEARARGLDGLLVWGRGGETGESAANILFYANHFSAYPGQADYPGFLTGVEHACVLIDREGHSTLLVSGFASEDADADEVRRSMNLYGLVVEVIRERGLDASRLGVIGSEALPFGLVSVLGHDLPGVVLVSADEIAMGQKMKLEEHDLPMLRNAAQVGTAIVAAITDAAAPGVSEGDAVGAGLAEAARSPGCIHWAFMIASGPDQHLFVRSGTPAWNPRYVYQPGDVLHVDAYGFVFGYMYDLMRTVVVGAEPTDGQRRTIETSRDLIAAIAGDLRPGVTPRMLHATGTEFAAARGLDSSGNATFGHGINVGWGGPFMQEPLDRPGIDDPIEAPYAFAFETFLNDGEGNHSKWEDMYAWTDAGVERLTGANPGAELASPLSTSPTASLSA